MSKKYFLFRSRAEKFFVKADHHTAKTKDKIKILRPERLEDFIDFLISSRVPSDKHKLLIALLASTGPRISEIVGNPDKNVVGVTKKDFKIKSSETIVKLRVVKKRFKQKPVIKYRWASIHPSIVPLLQKYLKNLKAEEKLFNMSTTAVYELLDKMFGANCHSFRHSCITYFIKEQGWTPEEVKNNWFFESIDTALKYFNESTEEVAVKVKWKKSGS